jgi:crossover junction endodeoxyribonuclease RuvC
MRVIAIDPGYDRIGVAVLEKSNTGETLVFSTCITTTKTATVPERIFELGLALEKILITYQPTTLALETLFFNKNISTGISVAEARGAILFLAQKHGCLVREFSPQEIKVATTGYGKSDKTAVIAMVKRLLKNVPEKALDDEYDAIATGLTCLATHR